MKPRCGCCLVLWMVGLSAAGCGGPQPVTGGTPGVLHAGAALLSDIQITIQHTNGEVAGFGISGPDGHFELVQNGARGPLWLVPGEYRVTLESVGSVPVQFPKEYTKAETTPLKISWSPGDQQLDLDVPRPSPSR